MGTEHYRTIERDSEALYWNNCPACGQTGMKLGESDTRESIAFECPDGPVRESEVTTSQKTDRSTRNT